MTPPCQKNRMEARSGSDRSLSGECQFDVAVKRHQLLDVIRKASDTGIRQIL
jgi:hypothetical protein